MLLTYLRARLGREEGQTLVEYGLIISLVALAVVAGLTLLAGGINGLFSTINDQLAAVPGP